MEFLTTSVVLLWRCAQPGGWGFTVLWQVTQVDRAPWSWQPAQFPMFCRAAVPCTMPAFQPGGWGVLLLVSDERGEMPCSVWQASQYALPWQRRQLAGSALASMVWRDT